MYIARFRGLPHSLPGAVWRWVLTLLMLGPALSTASPADLTGTWMTVDHKLDNGSDYKVYFRLQQSGSELSGQAIYPWGDVELRSGTVAGNHFKLVQHLWQGMESEDEGQLVGDRLIYTGTSFDHQPHPYVATRVAAQEADPPARLPVPPLRAVPDNGLAKTPPMGWNSWNKFGTRVTDELIRQIADAMVTNGMRDAGYEYINIDDGWEGTRDKAGVLHANQKFPNMNKLAEYLHSKGLKLGIYSSPGANTCAGYEGSLGHEQLDAKTFAGWGVDYLKYDVCGATKIYRDDEMRGVYQKMGEALLQARRPIVFSISADENTYLWGAQAGGNLWRTTGDINPTWKIVSENGFSQSALAAYAGPGHWNDPDMLEVGNGNMTLDEYQTHLSLWAMLAAPLIAGNDLRTMDDQTLKLLTNRQIIALDQDPLGRQGSCLKKLGEQEIWLRPLAAGALAVALFNRGEQPASMSLQLADIHVAPGSEVHDLWAGKDLQPANGQIVVTVPRHGVALLRIPAATHP